MEGKTQGTLIQTLNPQIAGWANYYRTSVAKRIFASMDKQLDRQLVCWTRRKHPTQGYRWRPPTGDGRLGTIGDGPSAYPMIGHPLDDFSVVYGYPWGGEEPMMLDLMRSYGRRGARLLMHGDGGVRSFVDGRDIG